MPASVPQGHSIESVQYWIASRTGWEGRKRRLGAEFTIYALEFVAMNPTSIWRGTRRDVTGMIAAHVKRRAREERVKRYGFIGGLFLSIFIGVIVNIIVRHIMAWLYPDEGARQAVSQAFTPERRDWALNQCLPPDQAQ